MTIAGIEPSEHLLDRGRAAIMEIRRRAPEFDQSGGIKGSARLARGSGPGIICLERGIKRGRMTDPAPRLFKDLPASPNPGSDLRIGQKRAGQRFEGFQIGVNGQGIGFWADHKLDMAQTGANGRISE